MPNHENSSHENSSQTLTPQQSREQQSATVTAAVTTETQLQSESLAPSSALVEDNLIYAYPCMKLVVTARTLSQNTDTDRRTKKQSLI
jgi:hypothetical protein